MPKQWVEEKVAAATAGDWAAYRTVAKKGVGRMELIPHSDAQGG